MGSEVSSYMTEIVRLMQEAYGANWNIITRSESPAIDDLAWQVMVGVSRQLFEEDGALGLNLKLECAATVRYVSKARTHASGFQAIDIANTLAAWLAQTIDTVTGVLPQGIEVNPEPILVRGPEGQMMNSGRYVAHVFWTIPIDRIDPDIQIEGYVTGHPARQRVVDTDLGVDIDAIDVILVAESE